MTIKVDTIPVLPDVLYLVQFPAGNNSAGKTKKFIKSIAPDFDALKSKGSDVTFIGYNTDGPINIVVNTDSHDVSITEDVDIPKLQWDGFIKEHLGEFYPDDSVMMTLLENQYKWYAYQLESGKSMMDWRVIATLTIHIIKNSRLFKDLPTFPMHGPISAVSHKAVEAKTRPLRAKWIVNESNFDPSYFRGLADELVEEYDALYDSILSIYCTHGGL